jgi:DNA (cytosine-5)-methyltransferase 1
MADDFTFGSLFSGIGGFDYGLERAGWSPRWQVEINDYCQRVLAKHWPDVPRYGDVRGFPGGGGCTTSSCRWCRDEYGVDLIVGGFPCQPVSAAGRQAAQSDPRWLWPEFARVIRVLRPRLVLVENVAALLSVNGGSAYGDVLGDLAACGYDAEWDCLPASAFGAPHRRDRVWLVAYADRHAECGLQPIGQRRGSDSAIVADDGPDGALADSGPQAQRWLGDGRREQQPEGGTGSRDVANSADDGRGSRGERGSDPGGAREREHAFQAVADADRARQLQPQGRESGQRRRSSDGGLGHATGERRAIFSGREAHARLRGFRAARGASWWGAEPDVGRVANGVPARVDRLRGLGNAIVPDIAEWIGRRLREI